MKFQITGIILIIAAIFMWYVDSSYTDYTYHSETGTYTTTQKPTTPNGAEKFTIFATIALGLIYLFIQSEKINWATNASVNVSLAGAILLLLIYVFTQMQGKAGDGGMTIGVGMTLIGGLGLLFSYIFLIIGLSKKPTV